MDEPKKKRRAGAVIRDAHGRVLPYEPKDEHRREVEALAALGTPHTAIVLMIDWGRNGPLSEKTLRRHFAIELERGRARATIKIARRVFEQASDGHFPSQVLWLKCQGGWRESIEVQATGKDGAPLDMPAALLYLPAKNSMEDNDEAASRRAQREVVVLPPLPVTDTPPRLPTVERVPPEPSAHGAVAPLDEHIRNRFGI